jgi:Domain of unknown function (DUF4190)
MNEYQFQEQSSMPVLAAKQETPKTAVVCLVCGILSFFGFGIVGLFVVGIIAGFLALSKINKSGGSLGGKSLAIAGLILNGFSAVLTIVFYLFFLSGVLFYMSSSQRDKNTNFNAAPIRQR